MSYRWRTVLDINTLNQQEREACFSRPATPFSSFEFLSALETHGCVGEGTGWLPQHKLLERDGAAVGIFIGYHKTHSYGEYVFDWSWAEAYHRNGIQYYPKLLLAIPFSPVPTNKWLSTSEVTESQALSMLFESLPESDLSGVHFNYPQTQLDLDSDVWIERQGNQFHWFNREPLTNQAYRNFEHFLEVLTARKRKNILKERVKVQNMGIRCEWRAGADVSQQELKAFYRFYQATYYKRGQQGYLNLEFFQQVFATMSDSIRLLLCYKDQTPVAGALYFVSADTLYGRYWGCLEEYDALHFEACYYQGIAFCINNDISRFNPGTQGEHKIARGFEPVKTYSYHHLYLAPFQEAVARFCQEESKYNDDYMAACAERLPYKQVNENQ